MKKAEIVFGPVVDAPPPSGRGRPRKKSGSIADPVKEAARNAPGKFVSVLHWPERRRYLFPVSEFEVITRNRVLDGRVTYVDFYVRAKGVV